MSALEYPARNQGRGEGSAMEAKAGGPEIRTSARLITLNRIELLGGLAVAQGHQRTVHFRTRKTASLLAWLAYHVGVPQPRVVLIDFLWPDPAERAGRQSLSMALCWLRHLLEPPGMLPHTVIEADRFAVWLNPENVTTDVLEFKNAFALARHAQSPRKRAQLLSETIGLYRGELLPGFYEPWIPPQALLLTEMFVTALLDLASILEDVHAYGEAIVLLRRATVENPLREEPYRRLMRLHAALSQPVAGLQVYRELERILMAEIGEPPSAAARESARSMERLVKEEVSHIRQGAPSRPDGAWRPRGRLPARRISGADQDPPVSPL